MSYTICRNGFPNAFVGFAVNCHRATACQTNYRYRNDTSGAPVIGANVVEVGSTNGTITDVDGKFTLNVSVGAKLKVSYIGYNDQQITVGNSNSYTIILKEDTESLDEVVVVGYGTQKK